VFLFILIPSDFCTRLLIVLSYPGFVREVLTEVQVIKHWSVHFETRLPVVLLFGQNAGYDASDSILDLVCVINLFDCIVLYDVFNSVIRWHLASTE